jgi:pyruvate-formate lyase-activating enzyme
MEQCSMVDREKDRLPRLVFADCNGAVYDHPHLKMAGRSGDSFVLPEEGELVPLPEGSQLFTMPGRFPVGWDDEEGSYIFLQEVPAAPMDSKSLAVAAFLPPGYTRTLLPATELHDRWPTLPLWAYCSVGWRAGKFWATGIRVDRNPHWDPRYFQDDRELASKVKQFLRDCEGNRLVEQLSRCALEYHCFAAKNVFYRRWECPLPTSPVCNAECIGCLSFQPPGGCQVSHERITFIPTAEEVTQVALPHLQDAEDAIVSFGQGCEGEPLLQVDLLERSIAALRNKTDRGTINLNTNGSIPRYVERLCRAGLDSIRITLNSHNPDRYNRYFNPKGYGIGHVMESIHRARERGVFTATNLLVFPGITDQEEEVDGLISFIRQTNIDMVQVRNLNIDPDLYLQALGSDGGKGVGIPQMLDLLREKFPHLIIGYFNKTRETFPRASLGDST